MSGHADCTGRREKIKKALAMMGSYFCLAAGENLEDMRQKQILADLVLSNQGRY